MDNTFKRHTFFVDNAELRFYTFYKSIKTLLLTDMLSPPEIMLLVNKKSSMISGFVNTVNKEKAQVGVLS